jgi:putative endonuclease
MQEWTVYILQCADNTLYTGITNDLDKRLSAHQSGKGAKYTKGRGPLTVMYTEITTNKSDALKRELEIKSLNKKQKQLLIASYLSRQAL